MSQFRLEIIQKFKPGTAAGGSMVDELNCSWLEFRHAYDFYSMFKTYLPSALGQIKDEIPYNHALYLNSLVVSLQLLPQGG